MKHTFKILLAVVVLAFSTVVAMADKYAEYKKSYKLVRAIELLEEEKVQEAEQLLLQELDDHKDNCYAMLWLSAIQGEDDRLGEALNMLNKCIKMLPKKDEMLSEAYSMRSRVYEKLGDSKSALADLDTRIKLFPKEAESYESRGRYLMDKDQYEQADVDFCKMISLDEGNTLGYLGSGVCLRNLKRYDEAVSRFDQAIRLSPKNSNAYSHRAYCYMLSGKFKEAAEDIVKALDIDGDDLGYHVMVEMADSAYDVMDTQLKFAQMMDPTEPYWPFCRGVMREQTKRYKEAIESFESCQKMNYSVVVSRHIATCYESLGDYASALSVIQEALKADSTDVELRLHKARYLDSQGRTEEAIEECGQVIELAPRLEIGYSQRGGIKFDAGDVNGAIEDFSMALMIDPDNIYSYLLRGNCYLSKGQKEQALADYREVIARDTVASECIGAHYAYYELGDRDKAVALLDSLQARDSTEQAYDAACLYARMGEKEASLDYLRKALEGGYYNFHHIEHDFDLNNIRETEEYGAIIEEYKAKVEASIGHSLDAAEDEDDGFITTETLIPFSHEAGVTKVRCVINDLPLHFVFDAATSEVTISPVEATFMYKNDYLADADIVSPKKPFASDGNFVDGAVIMIRKVKIGELELTDVRATVVKGQKAPLKLGQAVLLRLGSVEIDNTQNVLKVIQRTKK